MDQETSIENIGAVEEGVEYLIELCKEYMGLNEQLKKQIEELEESLRVKQEDEERRSEESRKLMARVDGIKSRLNEYCDGVSSSDVE